MLFQIALAAPGTVNAARLAFGSSGGFGSTGPSRSARACAISLCVARSPDARAVNAAASAIEKDAVGHDVEILLPVVHHVVAEQNLAEARPVHLNARVASIALHRRGAAKNHGCDSTGVRLRLRNRRRRDKWKSLPWARRPA